MTSSLLRRWFAAPIVALTFFYLASFPSFAAAPPACDSTNGGITLPPNFCAEVVAANLGGARHLAVAPNGDLFVGLIDGGIVALHDSTGNGRFDVQQKFGDASVTGIAFHDGYLYFATPVTVERYKWSPGQLKPTGPSEVVVTGLPAEQEHHDKGLTFDSSGHLYINVGAPSNACQEHHRWPGVPGIDPAQSSKSMAASGCLMPISWVKPTTDGVRFATGLRQFPALTWHNDALYIVMNNRDQLDTLWPNTSPPRTTPHGPPSRCIAPRWAPTSAGLIATSTT